MLNRYNCLDSLMSAGITYQDACSLRRISMTLHRWHELECGDGNQYGSWCITRGDKPKRNAMGIRLDGGRGPDNENFVHDDDGKPYLEHHHYTHGKGKDYTSYTLLADKERGALKRLDSIMSRYPGFAFYVQTDPRGCSLYILSPEQLKRYEGQPIDSIYNNGIAVYK